MYIQTLYAVEYIIYTIYHLCRTYIFNILHYITLYYIILYYIILYYIFILQYIILCYIISYDSIVYYIYIWVHQASGTTHSVCLTVCVLDHVEEL